MVGVGRGAFEPRSSNYAGSLSSPAARKTNISNGQIRKPPPFSSSLPRGCWMASHLVGSLITCSEGCVGPGLSLAWTVWLRLRCNTRPMKEVGELAVCSSHSSESYWNMVEPRFQPLRGRGYFPASNLCLRSGLSVPTPCVFHRCSLRELRRCHFA